MSTPWPTNVPSNFDEDKPLLHCYLRHHYADGNVLKQPPGKTIKANLPMFKSVLSRDLNNQANIFWRGCKMLLLMIC